MIYQPTTILKILRGVPFDSTFSDVRDFKTKEEQILYFNGLTKYTFENLSYQRINSSVSGGRPAGTVNIPLIADAVYDCNYIAFQNSENYGGKWFYAFIKKINYISPASCQIEYEIDPWQTWQFDIKFKPSFVVREHPATDGLFENTVPEPVGVNYYEPMIQPIHRISNFDITRDFYLDESKIDSVVGGYMPPANLQDPGNLKTMPKAPYLTICFINSENFSNKLKALLSRYVQYIASGEPKVSDLSFAGYICGAYTNYCYRSFSIKENPKTIDAIFKELSQTGAINNIVSVTMGMVFLDNAYISSPGGAGINAPFIETWNAGESLETYKQTPTFKIPGKQDYQIKNKKLLSEPFSFYKVKIPNIIEETYSPQTFIYSNSVKFKILYVSDDGGSIYLLPENSPTTNNYENSAIKIPLAVQVGYSLNVANSELSVNRVSMGLQTLTDKINGVAGSVMMMAGAALLPAAGTIGAAVAAGGLLVGGASKELGSFSALAKIDSLKQQGDKPIGRQGNFGILYIGDPNTLPILYIEEYIPNMDCAKRLDDYFSRYGYAVAEVKIPNLTGRQSFNYVELDNPVIVGSVPVEDMVSIKSMFTRGIRIWHTADVGNYSLSNSPEVVN